MKTTPVQCIEFTKDYDAFPKLLRTGDEVKAMFSVYRKSPQSDFNDADVQCVNEQRPHIEAAIERIEKLHV